MKPTLKHVIHVVCASLLLTACSTNPVTGKRELSLMSEAAELSMGKKMYLPLQQQSGGAYNLNPNLSAYVSGVGQRLAAVSHRPGLPYEFVVLNNSTPNAWALPGGKIAINRGLLLELEDEAALAAVLGHEIVHVTAKHSARQQDNAMLMGLGVQLIGVGARNNKYGQLINQGANLGGAALMSRYGRDDELESDFYGMQYMVDAGYNPEAAVDLQKTFVRLSASRQTDWLSGLFASHPPSQQRVQANEARALALNAGGVRNQTQHAIKQLVKDKPAYDHYEEGKKAYTDKNIDEASRLAKQAIALQPKESLFHELLALSQQQQKQPKTALKTFDKAITLNGRLFSHYLYRGLLLKDMNRPSEAEQDLLHSVKLLPTSIAQQTLGELARSAGNTAQAIQYFKTVASSQNGYQQAAQIALAELNLPTEPSKYFRTELTPAKNGEILVRIQNVSPIPVASTSANLVLIGTNGAQVAQKLRFGKLDPNAISAYQRTGVYINSDEGTANYRLQIDKASL